MQALVDHAAVHLPLRSINQCSHGLFLILHSQHCMHALSALGCQLSELTMGRVGNSPSELNKLARFQNNSDISPSRSTDWLTLGNIVLRNCSVGTSRPIVFAIKNCGRSCPRQTRGTLVWIILPSAIFRQGYLLFTAAMFSLVLAY